MKLLTLADLLVPLDHVSWKDVPTEKLRLTCQCLNSRFNGLKGQYAHRIQPLKWLSTIPHTEKQSQPESELSDAEERNEPS